MTRGYCVLQVKQFLPLILLIIFCESDCFPFISINNSHLSSTLVTQWAGHDNVFNGRQDLPRCLTVA